VRVVCHTNVLIAAFLTDGICAKLLIRARKRDFDLILCSGMLQECKAVLKKEFNAPPHETTETLTLLSEAALEIQGITDSITPICRDSDDDLILACARQAGADNIVTGDEDLLVLKNYKGINIVNPRELERLFSD
jgi:uncharacterized protein